MISLNSIFPKVLAKSDTSGHKKSESLLTRFFLWALLDSNQRPPACKAGALNQLS
jgi:hypothetical protein